ncbi:hypothetical protein KCU78_g64, partial [Aureobasidium melanogenum]
MISQSKRWTKLLVSKEPRTCGDNETWKNLPCQYSEVYGLPLSDLVIIITVVGFTFECFSVRVGKLDIHPVELRSEVNKSLGEPKKARPAV